MNTVDFDYFYFIKVYLQKQDPFFYFLMLVASDVVLSCVLTVYLCVYLCVRDSADECCMRQGSHFSLRP